MSTKLSVAMESLDNRMKEIYELEERVRSLEADNFQLRYYNDKLRIEKDEMFSRYSDALAKIAKLEARLGEDGPF